MVVRSPRGEWGTVTWQPSPRRWWGTVFPGVGNNKGGGYNTNDIWELLNSQLLLYYATCFVGKVCSLLGGLLYERVNLGLKSGYLIEK